MTPWHPHPQPRPQKKTARGTSVRGPGKTSHRGTLLGWLPVTHSPPVVNGRVAAEPPVPVFPAQRHRAPAKRHARERVERADERERLVRIEVRIGDARVIVVRGGGRPGRSEER